MRSAHGSLGRRIIASWQLYVFLVPAILFIAVFAAVITPSSDPYTMTAMMVPMILFYEGAILAARLMGK